MFLPAVGCTHLTQDLSWDTTGLLCLHTWAVKKECVDLYRDFLRELGGSCESELWAHSPWTFVPLWCVAESHSN